MNPRSIGASAVVVFSTLAVISIAALVLGASASVLACAVAVGGASTLLFVLWRRADRARSELEVALTSERERARSAREQAWQNAFLGQVVEELRAFHDEDDLWAAATTALGRALEASRVVVYEKDARGVYRLRAQFVADGVPTLDEGSSIPASVVQDRELQARISRSDLAVEEDPELRALAAGLRLRSLVVVPVEREGSERTAIAVHHCDDQKKWTDGERRFLQRLSEHVAGVLDRAKLSRRLSYEAEVRLGLLQLAQALAGLRDAASVVEVAVSVGAPLARATVAAVLLEDDRNGFRIAASSGIAERPGSLSLSALRPRLDEAIRERSKVSVDGAGGSPGLSLTLVPMFCGRALMGVFLFGCDSSVPTSDALDLQVAQSIGDLVAAALENARLFDSISSSELSLRAHWNEGGEIALAVDESGAIQDANPAASRLLGYTPGELAGARLDTLLTSESAALWRKLEPALLRGARLREQPLKLRSKDGSTVDVSASASASGIPGSTATRVRLSMRDVTELRKLENQLRQSQKLEVIGALAGGIAHDFNNVLGGILGYASLLRTYLKDRPTAAKYVETIERAAVRGAELSGRLLAASRKSPGQLAPVNLNQVIEETLELLTHTIPKGIRIDKRLDPRLHLMMADASQLQQIVLNLCVNARDAMPEGGLLRVSTRLLEGTEGSESRRPGRKVLISVEDSGVGMDAKTLSRLFEPFFSTKGEAGTGLGLSVVYGIVKSLGGDVGVKSSPGRGARFEVVLPCLWAEESLVETQVEEVARGQGELILLVDDEKVLRDLGKDILESQGYRVATVSSGEEALDYLRDARDVALVILDVVMPGLGGNETYRRLRGFDRSIPVLFSSGLTAEQSVRDILDEGCAGFIPKPYGIGDLTRAVSSVLRRDNPTLVH
jgi:PAS domain S-box-containing protein